MLGEVVSALAGIGVLLAVMYFGLSYMTSGEGPVLQDLDLLPRERVVARLQTTDIYHAWVVTTLRVIRSGSPPSRGLLLINPGWYLGGRIATNEAVHGPQFIGVPLAAIERVRIETQGLQHRLILDSTEGTHSLLFRTPEKAVKGLRDIERALASTSGAHATVEEPGPPPAGSNAMLVNGILIAVLFPPLIVVGVILVLYTD